MVKVSNLVVRFNLNRKLDSARLFNINNIQSKAKGNLAQIKSSKMEGVVSIYFGGTLISTGTKRIELAKKDLEYTIKVLEENGLVEVIKVIPRIINITAILDLHTKIPLEEISLDQIGIYEPEQFPALILKNKNPKSTYLIFNSGKIVITGVNSFARLEIASEYISSMLLHYL